MLGELYGLDGKQLQAQYYNHLSDYSSWDQKAHAEDYILFPDNIGASLSMDETALSRGELYTIVTNKEGKGRKGTLVAMIKGTVSSKVINILANIPKELRDQVKEITIDLAPTMELIAKRSFENADRVSDRFHVQKLASDAVQEIRIRNRWEAIEQDNKERELAKEEERNYKPFLHQNGDTLKQLLARSRYLLFKNESKWTPTQVHRSEILFKLYPDLEQAYNLSQHLARIFNRKICSKVAYKKLALWHQEVERKGFKSFLVISKTIQNNYTNILNYFKNRSTNASAESFNAKIKALRRQFRGVSNSKFFLFRLATIYS